MRSIELGHAPIKDHTFSSDKSLLAVARGNEVELYYEYKGKYSLGSTLRGHDRPVTAVDINVTGEIVTCSQDRNALVWKAQQDGTWRPTLVLLRINRAATSVRWSPNGQKFAVSTGARIIAVCYYDEENDWWISKHIKRPLKSTVLSVAWHPNSVLLAAGSTDGHARVFSGYIKGLDEKPAPSAWGERLPFQQLCGDFTDDSAAWVHDVAFSPSGDVLAWVTHDSSILVAYPSGPDQPPQAVVSIATSYLPFRSLAWVTENSLVAGGFDCQPIVFSGDNNGWQLEKSLDDAQGKTGNRNEDESQVSALHLFRQLDLKGVERDETALPTVHQNAIATLRNYSQRQISTSGDGRVVIWDI